MEEIAKELKELLKETKEDKYAEYGEAWRQQAVATINNYYYEVERYDDIIYDLASDEWDEIVKHEAENGWLRLMFFLGQLEPTSEYAYINAYGNAVACDYDIKGTIEDILQEIKENN